MSKKVVCLPSPSSQEGKVQKMKIYSKILIFCVISFALAGTNGFAQSSFWDDIIRAGYDSLTVNDLSSSAKVKIMEQPTLAYVNVTGINSFPTQKTYDLHALAEVTTVTATTSRNIS